ncbi:MAG TPA: hypothetical protein ENJ19_05525 [Gammaproteobacteria bacterium]|nr:hypothetical protein [Gammaproteobacteria bacterium]
MSSPLSAPLYLERRASPVLAGLILLSHVSALLALGPLSLPGWGKLALAGAVLGAMVQGWRRQACPGGAGAVTKLVWRAEGGWVLVFGDGREEAAVLRLDCFVHPLLTVLRFVTAGGRRINVVLPRDGLDEDGARRLRVRLRLARSQAPAPPP